MYFGSIGCGICFTLVTVGLGVGTKPSNGMAVAFMFAYHLCYAGLSLVLRQIADLSRVYRSSPYPFSIHQKSTRHEHEVWQTVLPWSPTGSSYMSL